MKRLRQSGMFFFEGDRKFLVRGVSYGPFKPNPLGENFPDKEVVERDFESLRRLGANTVRVYDVPPTWITELAAAFDLRVLVGVPWEQHVRFLDSAHTRGEIRRRIRDAAQNLRGAANLMGILVGNEIPPQLVRWYGPARLERFLAQLASEVKEADPEALVSYANFPMTEYLNLDFADFFSFNVYLHRCQDLRKYLGRLQNLAGAHPLLLSEFGVDSSREGEESQAEIVSRAAATAAEIGCAGTIVFSFTDEWYTGGFEIEDWSFGLVTRERVAKPAFERLQQVYRSEVPQPPEPAPMVSVVICAYNAERTLEECLESLRRPRYPNFEVIVIDDGSTDSTKEIAERFPEFRLISHENRGLSAARNDGIAAAQGEVIAFTDADCAVDPDWLTFLVSRLLSGDFAGVGGPNLPPPEDHWVPEVVAHSPGGPTHVLITDSEAEHVPGCNMAFWRERLVEVGGFDPIFAAAGDDVDVCWRLQNAGHKIGFAASALVWHRRRNTVRAYLRQQRGYGYAEALLYFKHPRRFNQLGHSRWLGRIYGGLSPGILGRRAVVYGGPFGNGLFQTLYAAPSSLLRQLPGTLEWNAAALVLILIGATASAVDMPLPTFLGAGLALLAISVAQAVHTALRMDCNGMPPFKARALVAVLSYVGPLVRALERHGRRLNGLSRVNRRPVTLQRLEVDLRRRCVSLSYWNETAIEKEACISALLDFLRPRKYAVVLDDGWQPWDLTLQRGLWVLCRVNVLVQNHGQAKRQVDIGIRLRQTGPTKLLKAGAGVGTALAAAAGMWSVVALLAGGLILAEAFFIRQAWRLGTSLRDAIATSFRSLPLYPMRNDGGGGRP